MDIVAPPPFKKGRAMFPGPPAPAETGLHILIGFGACIGFLLVCGLVAFVVCKIRGIEPARALEARLAREADGTAWRIKTVRERRAAGYKKRDFEKGVLRQVEARRGPQRAGLVDADGRVWRRVNPGPPPWTTKS
jgi:hypothetical protein